VISCKIFSGRISNFPDDSKKPEMSQLNFPPSFLSLAAAIMILVGCGDGRKIAHHNHKSYLVHDATGQRASGVFLPSDGPTEKDYPELHNLIQVTDKVYSGAEPKTEAAFGQLAELGVKTIVSVDGAIPNVNVAKKYGIRYVHIPIGYDGLGGEASRSFAQAADELNETTYVHCHHGKHRGPAGAAAICIARGDFDGRRGLKILEKAGTSTGYAGLWRDVEAYQRPALDDELPELLSVAKVGSLAATMVQIDRALDNLKLCEIANWRTPSDHPDLAPQHEALLLKEGFRETLRRLTLTDLTLTDQSLSNLPDSNDYDDQFLVWMRESEQSASQLESVLKIGDAAKISKTLATVKFQCQRCHAEYRNR
jgi:protein tyrosine phosphatase (PTP) superfamily phosphohydrolase (DUF442 family)